VKSTEILRFASGFGGYVATRLGTLVRHHRDFVTSSGALREDC
jgi:hypothetical protein